MNNLSSLESIEATPEITEPTGWQRTRETAGRAARVAGVLMLSAAISTVLRFHANGRNNPVPNTAWRELDLDSEAVAENDHDLAA